MFLSLAFEAFYGGVGDFIIMKRFGPSKFDEVDEVAETEDHCNTNQHECHQEIGIVPGSPLVHAIGFQVVHLVF